MLSFSWVRALQAVLLAALPFHAAGQTGVSAPKVLIVYHSDTGHTMNLASAIAKGATEAGAVVRLLASANATYAADVMWADAVIVGSPTHYGNPSAEILRWFAVEWESGFYDKKLGGKVGSAFATGGGVNQGVAHVVTGLQRVLESFRIQYVAPDPSRNGYHSYGAVAITGTEPFNTSCSSDFCGGAGIAPVFAVTAAELGAKVVAAARVQMKCSSN